MFLDNFGMDLYSYICCRETEFEYYLNIFFIQFKKKHHQINVFLIWVKKKQCKDIFTTFTLINAKHYMAIAIRRGGFILVN